MGLRGCYPPSKGQQAADAGFPVPLPVTLPQPHFYPANSLALDMISSKNVNPGTSQIMAFTCPQGYSAYLVAYAVADNSAVLNPSPVPFFYTPTVAGARIYQFHGDPTNNFQISTDYGAGLSDLDLRKGVYIMSAGQKLLWTATNQTGGALFMAVRQIGYLLQGPPVTLPA